VIKKNTIVPEVILTPIQATQQQNNSILNVDFMGTSLSFDFEKYDATLKVYLMSHI